MFSSIGVSLVSFALFAAIDQCVWAKLFSNESVFLVYPTVPEKAVPSMKSVFKALPPLEDSFGNSESQKLLLVDYNGKSLEYDGPSLAYNYDPVDINDWIIGTYDKAIRINRALGSDFNAGTINNYFIKESLDDCTSIEHSSSISQARGQLFWVRMRLRNFISDSGFNLYGFESEGRSLAQWLVKLESLSEKIYPCGRKFDRELEQARLVFNEMADAVELLKYYLMVGTPGHVVLYSIIDLNVMLLGLRDSSGIPDRTLEGYSGTVSFYSSFLKQLSRQFTRSSGRSLGMEIMFRKQYLKAEEAIGSLL